MAKVFVAAVIIDLIYEVIVFHRIYPGQSVIVAAIPGLATIPVDPWFGEPHPEAPLPKQEGSRTGRRTAPRTRSLATSPEGFVIECQTWP